MIPYEMHMNWASEGNRNTRFLTRTEHNEPHKGDQESFLLMSRFQYIYFPTVMPSNSSRALEYFPLPLTKLNIRLFS